MRLSLLCSGMYRHCSLCDKPEQTFITGNS